MDIENAPLCNANSSYFSTSAEKTSNNFKLDKFSANKSAKKFAFNSLNSPEKFCFIESNSISVIPFKKEVNEVEVIYHETLTKKSPSPIKKKLFHDYSAQKPSIKPTKSNNSKLNTNVSKEQPKINAFLAKFQHDSSSNKLARFNK